MIMKIGINGTGLTARAIIKLIATIDEFSELEVAQMNGRSMTIDQLKDRLIFSTAHGHSGLDVTVNHDKEEIVVNGQPIKYTRTPNPEEIDWNPEIKILIEATGNFRDISKHGKDPSRHFKSPNNKFKAIIISAPGKGGLKDYMWIGSPDLESEIKELVEKTEPFIIGGASCTTTATVPLVDTLDEAFGVESCYLTTIHAVTRSQDLLDGSKGWSAFDCQLRSTGATLSTNRVIKKDIPLDGIAFRNADKTGSFIQIDAVLKEEVSKKDIIKAFKESKYKDYISYPEVSTPPSSYVRGNHSMVLFLPEQTSIIGKKRVVLKGMYDNEEGYASHFLRLVNYVASQLEVEK
jgi:glyceraldehyde 3-phosphate dehydrogenase